MRKRILITGANGFIGQSLIESFEKSNYEIYALDLKDKPHSFAHNIKEYIYIDISKQFNLDIEFDAVIHLAALNQTNINSNFSYDQFHMINVVGTENVVKGCRYKKFILFSTANIYEKTGREIDENSPIKPNSFYETTKYEAEIICQKIINNEKLCILRPVNIIGIKQENKAIIPYFFSKAVRNEPIEVFVPRNRRIQLLSVADLTRAVETIITSNNIYGIFNLSGNDSMEVKAIAEKIINICNSSSVLNCTNNNLEAFSRIISDKAKEVINWCSRDDIDTIINDFAHFFLQSKQSSYK